MSAPLRLLLALAVPPSALAQKATLKQPPIVPVSMNETGNDPAGEIEFVIDPGIKKATLSIHAPGWVDWSTKPQQTVLAIDGLPASQVTKLGPLPMFMADWVAETEKTDAGIQSAFFDNVRYSHRKNEPHHRRP